MINIQQHVSATTAFITLCFFSNKPRTVQDSERVRCCLPPMAHRVGQGVPDPCKRYTDDR